MPEGPEIKRAVDEIAKAVAGKTADRVEFGLPRLKSYQKELSGATVLSVEARSKAVLTGFDCGLTVYSHNQLYGRWYVEDAGKRPATGRQLRFAIHCADVSALLYSASEIDVLDEAGLAEHPYLARLGPDILNSRVSWRKVAARYRDAAFARKTLAALLLDQGFLAGVGNYLRSEILYAARVAPQMTPGDCSDAQIEALARASCELMRRSYRTGGITTEPALVKDLKRAGYRRGQFRFAVFAREGQPCHECGTEIVRKELAGRRVYLCPACQSS